jgi:signal transduction histidine kinase/CheY-like chemotaxis protein
MAGHEAGVDDLVRARRSMRLGLTFVVIVAVAVGALLLAAPSWPWDVILESIRVAITGSIFVFLLRTGSKEPFKSQQGWWFLASGFALLLLSSAVDLTDNFDSLSRFQVVGDTPYQAFIEKYVGAVGGFALVFVGLWYWLPLVRDLRRTKDDLQAQADRLETAVQERTTELAVSNEHLRESLDAASHLQRQAETALEANDTFLGTMSHEIRTPLNAVIGMTEILQTGELTEQQAECADIIGTAGGLLLEVVTDILDFERLRSGSLSLERRPFDLGALAQRSIEGLAAETRERRSHFEYDPALPRQFVGDEVRLRQVLMNLLGNAAKFTAAGEISCTVSGTPRGEGEWTVRITVADTGDGIPVTKLPRIFDAFVQADASTTRTHGGSGLGLAITKGVVDAMGGEITVTSEPGRGSTFVVTIPLEAASSWTSDVVPVSPAPTRPALAVLVAEDNAVNQIVAVRMLERLGHAVTLVENGAEAVQIVERGTVDLVLMDCHMPVMDGYAATRAIRALASPFDRVPIIAMTANEGPSDVKQSLEAGMNDHLTKPVTLGALESILRKWEHARISRAA